MFLFHRARSLQRVLLLPYILLMLVLSLVIGLFSYQAGSQAVEEVAEHLLVETAQRIRLAVKQHLDSAPVVLGAAFPKGMPAPADIHAAQRPMTERFWIATSLNQSLYNFVYYGNRHGLSFDMLRQNAESAELRVRRSPSEKRHIYKLDGLLGTPQLKRVEDSLFDPRQRPWYKLAIQTTREIWTPVYIDFLTHQLVLTRARSVRLPDGTVEGVVATDVFLRMLSTEVHNLDISPNGLAFIIEPDGAMIASSKGPKVTIGRHNGPRRLNAMEDREPLVRETYSQLRHHFNPVNGHSPQTTTFHFETSSGEAIYAAYNWITDDAGLAWLIVVAVPRSDFMGQLANNVLRTLVIALIAVAMAILVGLYIGRWVLGDITRLSIVANKIGKGQINVPLRLDRRDEIGELARALESMQVELSTDHLTGLNNRAALVRQVSLATTERQKKADTTSGFALLFIDLNRFKAINDTYGHEAGDLALIEVARRLRESVRQTDLVARLGGDEFVIVLWRTTSSELVERICSKIEQLLSAPLTTLTPLIGDHQVHVGAAVGVAIYPADGETADDLIKHADLSMYQDKQCRA